MKIFFSFFVALCAFSTQAIASTSLKFLSYNQETKLLQMKIVTPTLDGQTFLRVENKLFRLHHVYLNNIFVLKVNVPCAKLSKKNTMLIWKTKTFQLSSGIPQQACIKDAYVVNEHGKCEVYTNGTTLWHTALMLTKVNSATVYQNMYALFLENKHAFSGEDISKLKTNRLNCPSTKTISLISPEHAKTLFREAMAFKASSSQY
ncbi:hypothetical protein [Aeromonas enteropelogenes]|uniref:hypothetical protein n=1 Tax=Aeromonas enteropelogenes TaxID=29489 RepID=UPI003BA26D45